MNIFVVLDVIEKFLERHKILKLILKNEKIWKIEIKSKMKNKKRTLMFIKHTDSFI